MNARPRVVVSHAVGWCVIVFFVVLLTVIFSFLGTIICAALAGMMMGSARLPRWHCLLGSLIFPAVVFTVLRFSRAGIADTQVLLLSALCLGVFWAIYAVMSALVGQEVGRKEPRKSRPGANGPAEGPVEKAARTLVGASDSPPRTSELKLESLQGIWLARLPIQDESKLRKVLEIRDQTAVLSVLDANGEICSKAHGRFELNGTAKEGDAPSNPSDELVTGFNI